MRRSRYTEEQIIGILKQHQAGLGAKELCRKHGISDATFYIYGLLPRGKKYLNVI
jgi:putative transposase